MDQHHRANKYIQEYIEQNVVPKTGNTLIHFDAHIDELVPEDMQIRVQLESKSTQFRLYREFGLENWIKTGVDNKCFKHVIWVKPPWAIQTGDGHRDLENDVTLDIKTLGRSIFENDEEDLDGFKTIFSKYLSPGDPYILDFELNFFSSDNPFTTDYPDAEGYYSRLSDLFKLNLPAERDNESLERAAEQRDKELKEMSEILEYLEKNRVLPEVDGNPSMIYKKIVDLREELLKYYEDKEINWHNIYESGVACNNHLLPVHHTKREDIEKMFKLVEKLLDILETPPAMVTIALMYEYDRYVPQTDYVYLQEKLQEFFEERYETNYIYEDF
ncbi:Misexpression suppressor of ras 6 [Carabus blaptoides fortunei]